MDKKERKERVKTLNDAIKVSKRKLRILNNTFGMQDDAAKENAILEDLRNQLKLV
ncbi:unnamed protein product [marine sediment metagenome]|uniref:Uncharacterized protein n=1 Tax=marine sediment metagenome TaxID=412755 RepID=X0X9C3_9ZZZZ